MTDSKHEKFNIPTGFTLEEIHGQLYHEDLEEDDELWLIRMPCDIELSTLDKQKIFLSNDIGDMSVKNFKTENGRCLECYAETREISNTCVVLPKKQDEKLHAVKKGFKGAILISEGLSSNNVIEIKSEKDDNRLDNNLSCTVESTEEKVANKKKKSHSYLDTSDLSEKCENEQIESTNNSVSKKKKKKKHLQTNFDSSDLNYETKSAESVYSAKNTKKKRHLQADFDSSDLNYDTEAAENIHLPNSQKKRSKKHSTFHRKSSEKQNVKGEDIATPMDLDDGFPTCKSQKYHEI